MVDVLLFHHAQGLTPGVEALADELRGAGHVVHAPDLYDGKTYATLDDGIAHAAEVGFGEILERGVRVADGLPDDLVYLGLSLGVMPAQRLAQTRPGARGALLVEACIPVTEFGDAWPASLPVQVHGMEADPVFAGEGDVEAARELVAQADRGELFVYPGDRHLFTDPSLATHDEAAAALVRRRLLDFLAAV